MGYCFTLFCFSATAVRFSPYVNCCFSPRAFYLDQSNMPPSAAPKAALIDKVRTTLCCIHDIMEKLKNGIRSQSCNVEVFARVTCWNLQSGQQIHKCLSYLYFEADRNQDWAIYQYNIIVVIWDYFRSCYITTWHNYCLFLVLKAFVFLSPSSRILFFLIHLGIRNYCIDLKVVRKPDRESADCPSLQ